MLVTRAVFCFVFAFMFSLLRRLFCCCAMTFCCCCCCCCCCTCTCCCCCWCCCCWCCWCCGGWCEVKASSWLALTMAVATRLSTSEEATCRQVSSFSAEFMARRANCGPLPLPPPSAVLLNDALLWMDVGRCWDLLKLGEGLPLQKVRQQKALFRKTCFYHSAHQHLKLTKKYRGTFCSNRGNLLRRLPLERGDLNY